MIGACYIRVSTEEQTEYSPDAQLRAIREYCKKNNIFLDDNYIYIDAGISGKKAEKRPAFMKMISDAKKKPKPFAIILVHKFDRFARSRQDSIVYKSLLKKDCGIKVVSISEPIDDSNISVVIEAVLESTAEYYSLNLADEVKKGQREKILRGEPLVPPPLGYKMINNRYEIIDEDAHKIKLIFEKFNNGDGILKIVRYLNKLGLTTKTGDKFDSQAIDRILRNVTYKGYLKFNLKTDGKDDVLIQKGIHIPIINDKDWDKANNRIKEQSELFYKYKKSNIVLTHWLLGLIRCGKCQSTLVVNSIYHCKGSKLDGNKYLRCNKYNKGKCNCSSSLSLLKAEKVVLRQLKKDFEDPININIIQNNSDNETINTLQLELDRIKQKRERITLSYQNGIDTLEEYKHNKQKLMGEETNISKELNELINKSIDVKDIKKKFKNLYDILTNPLSTNDEKIVSSHTIINKIIFDKDKNDLILWYNIRT